MPITDRDVEPLVNRELEPGETLLWSGRPGQGLRVRRADAHLIPFTILWAGFFVFWEAWGIRSGQPLVMRLFGVPFLVVGVYLVAGRFFVDALKRRNTAYALTDRRVIIVSGLFSPRTMSHALRAIPGITLSERLWGEGDVVLAATGMSHVGIGGLVPRGSTVPPALEFLPNASRVCAMVEDARRRVWSGRSSRDQRSDDREPENAARIRREFARIADRYRVVERRGKWAAAGFCATLLAIGIVRPPQPIPSVLGLVAVAWWLAAMVFGFSLPGLSCPNCEEQLDRALLVYCPECGQNVIDDLSERTSCTACGASFTRSGRGGRWWTIRWCTVCGVLLDDRGV